jgi:hypothetical protein
VAHPTGLPPAPQRLISHKFDILHATWLCRLLCSKGFDSLTFISTWISVPKSGWKVLRRDAQNSELQGLMKQVTMKRCLLSLPPHYCPDCSLHNHSRQCEVMLSAQVLSISVHPLGCFAFSLHYGMDTTLLPVEPEYVVRIFHKSTALVVHPGPPYPLHIFRTEQRSELYVHTGLSYWLPVTKTLAWNLFFVRYQNPPNIAAWYEV